LRGGYSKLVLIQRDSRRSPFLTALACSEKDTFLNLGGYIFQAIGALSFRKFSPLTPPRHSDLERSSADFRNTFNCEDFTVRFSFKKHPAPPPRSAAIAPGSFESLTVRLLPRQIGSSYSYEDPAINSKRQKVERKYAAIDVLYLYVDQSSAQRRPSKLRPPKWDKTTCRTPLDCKFLS